MAFNVLDSTNKIVGKYISLNGEDSAMVQLKINNHLYTLPVYFEKIANDEESISLFYTSTDCSGQAYIGLATGFINRWRLTPLGWVTHSPEGVIPKTIVLPSQYSRKDVTFSGEECNVEDGGFEFQGFKIEDCFGPDFRAGFTPPFRFE